MRKALAALDAADCSHFGYAYELLGPPPLGPGKADADQRDTWLAKCERIAVPADYRMFFQRWKSSFPVATSRSQEVKAASRLLIGHGNPSGSDVGLSVHHTWGVPIIPASAVKGLLAHYIDAVYGGAEDDRRSWRGPTWTQGRVAGGDGAGALYAILFGAPEENGNAGSARRGCIEFHDALCVPHPHGQPEKPFKRDVLTPHQSAYYRDPANNWPSDWDDPNPVPFLTVGPDVRLLVVLTGPAPAWLDRAMTLLLDAFKEWGVGAKTSAGYGRLTA